MDRACFNFPARDAAKSLGKNSCQCLSRASLTPPTKGGYGIFKSSRRCAISRTKARVDDPMRISFTFLPSTLARNDALALSIKSPIAWNRIDGRSGWHRYQVEYASTAPNTAERAAYSGAPRSPSTFNPPPQIQETRVQTSPPKETNQAKGCPMRRIVVQSIHPFCQRAILPSIRSHFVCAPKLPPVKDGSVWPSGAGVGPSVPGMPPERPMTPRFV